MQLRELGHVQLLMDSYRGAQRAVFAGAALPPVRPGGPPVTTALGLPGLQIR